MENFRQAIKDCHLKDMHSRGAKFTWHGNKRGAHIQEKLDRFLCNNGFDSLYPDAAVYNLDWLFSDHRPIEIILEAASSSKKGRYPKPFKFEENWIKYDECSNIIKTQGAWGNSVDDLLTSKLESCAVALGIWGRDVFLRRKNRIKACKISLKEAYSNPQSLNFDEIHRIEFELDNLLEEEEINWKQRSLEEWLKWGDKNSKWFHRKASIRGKNNEIIGILDNNGNCTEDPNTIDYTFISYFQNMF